MFCFNSYCHIKDHEITKDLLIICYADGGTKGVNNLIPVSLRLPYSLERPKAKIKWKSNSWQIDTIAVLAIKIKRCRMYTILYSCVSFN